ncbi:MAG: inositol monophosphatase family protein [Bifidobacterium sp.]|uniref:Inositol monophosphatase family protein n=1 Tax=Bifidobacterium fermentum TaxID=3059035 RepID=A0AB39UAY1_9BIFI
MTISSTMRFAAHRGVHPDRLGIKENTLASVKSAIAAHADLVEIDVRCTRDGRVIVLHDPDLLRVWGDSRKVEDLGFDELRAMQGDPDSCVPTLEEVLNVIHDSGSRLLIDMDDERFAEPAYDVVKALGLNDEVEWCGKYQAMLDIRSLDREAFIWMPWRHAQAPDESEIEQLHPQMLNLPYLMVGSELVEGAHALGLGVSCWTVDNTMQAAHLRSVGVDGITSNRMNAVRDALQLVDGNAQESVEEHDARARFIAGEIAAAAVETIQESNGQFRTNIHGKATPADLVTDLDGLIEQEVREALHAQFPETPVVGEEMGGNEPRQGDCWFLDPLDGTINYANAIPWFSFSLALVRNGDDPIVGAVIDPAGWRVITAQKNKGAWIGDRRITIPERSFDNAEDPVEGTIVSVELANNYAWPGLPGIFERLSKRFCTMRVPGTGTASVTGVALGRGVATLIGKFGTVDHFAAVLIVHEAGGVIMDETGKETLNPRNAGFLAARDRRCANAIIDVWHESLMRE